MKRNPNPPLHNQRHFVGFRELNPTCTLIVILNQILLLIREVMVSYKFSLFLQHLFIFSNQKSAYLPRHSPALQGRRRVQNPQSKHSIIPLFNHSSPIVGYALCDRAVERRLGRSVGGRVTQQCPVYAPPNLQFGTPIYHCSITPILQLLFFPLPHLAAA